MIEYSIYYKQVMSPCQEENVKIRCIFQLEYLQIPCTLLPHDNYSIERLQT